MNSLEIYHKYGQELYFFILKKVKDKHITNDIFQNTFMKVHKNLNHLQESNKSRSWAFQICRNEIANFYSKEQVYKEIEVRLAKETESEYENICCFDRFLDELPENYKSVIALTFLEGKKQEEAAQILNISISNVKARIRRSKAILKSRFVECCKYDIDAGGKVSGIPDCTTCS